MSFFSNIASSAVNLVSSFIFPFDSDVALFDPDRITLDQVNAAYEYLNKAGLPSEIALMILDYAEYWVYEHYTRSADLIANAMLGNNIHECASLYTHTTPLTAQLDPVPLLKPRKVVFKLKSRDQGWSNNSEDHGTYRGSFSWFEATIFREDEEFQGQTRREPLEGLLLSGLGSEVPRYQMSNTAPLFFVGRSPEQMMRVVKRNGYECRPNGDKLTWMLQRNIVANPRAVEHIIEWNLNDGTVESSEEESEETGTGTGRGFVASLQKGDRIGIWARAMVRHHQTITCEGDILTFVQYPGWQNRVEGAEITVYYAL
jgi:hypothetical protein